MITKRKRRIGFGTGVVALAVAGSVALAGGGSAAPIHATATWPGSRAAHADAATPAGSKTFTVTAKSDGNETFIDVGKKGTSYGDYYLFTETLRVNGHYVGHDNASCTFTPFNTTACRGTFTFDGVGQLTVDSAIPDNTDSAALAVTGGTGTYSDARGQFSIVGGSATTTVFKVVLYGVS